MASKEIGTTAAPEKKLEIPEWEVNRQDNATAGAKLPRRSPGAAFSGKLDSILPPHRRYLGFGRKAFLLALVAAIVLLLALIIGLAAGLTTKKHHQDLPLPSNTETFVGDLTYYEPGLGACGETDGPNDNIVAVSHILFDAAGSTSSNGGNSNNNPLCGKMLRATRYDEEYGQERSLDLKVVDRCTGCQPDDLDTTEGAFGKMAPVASGRVDVTWAWLEPVQTGS